MPNPQSGPRRIAINAQLLSTEASYRGAGTSHYLFHLLRELRALHAPEEVLAYVSAAHLPHELGPTETFLPRSSRWPTERPAMRIFWEQCLFPRALHADRADLVHGGAHALPLAWSGPSVVTIHDLAFLLLPHTSPRFRRIYLRWMVALAARKADRIIAVSESTRRDTIRLLGVPPDHVTCIYEGVAEHFRPDADGKAIAELRLRRGLPERFILCVATIEPRKNLIRLIDAYGALRARGCTGWHLVIAGGAGPGYQTILRHRASAALEDSVHFPGYVPESELPLWYNAASLFVFPSLYEGFGLPVLEALACGTPVVASNSSALPEVAGAAGILVDPADVATIADGMQRVLEDGGLREQLSSAGPVQAAKFTWRSAAEATLSLYRSILEPS